MSWLALLPPALGLALLESGPKVQGGRLAGRVGRQPGQGWACSCGVPAVGSLRVRVPW